MAKRTFGGRQSSASPQVMCRLVVTVCPKERGFVVLPIERGGRRRRLDALGVQRSLSEMVEGRGLDARVSVREGCAGGCTRPGPNVDVRIYPLSPPGAKPDTVALHCKTYVYSLSSLGSLAAIIDDNLYRRARDEWSE